MSQLTVNGIRVDDTFAEAFGMRATALTITAHSVAWANQAAVTMTGFATSVIGCGCESGIDRSLNPDETPDGRPGVRVLLFAVSTSELQKQLQNRVGQCVLTSPGSACYAGLEADEELKLGNALRFFGDGWQVAKRLGDKRYWRIPVMDGEFICSATTGLSKTAVGGGNIIVMGARRRDDTRRNRTRRGSDRRSAGCYPAFPGGIARSGSKVGSKYKGVVASTNDAYCPTLKGSGRSALDCDIASVLEIVIDGLTSTAVAAAMRAGVRAILMLGPEWAPLALALEITAASLVHIITTSRICCRERADLHLARGTLAARRSGGSYTRRLLGLSESEIAAIELRTNSRASVCGRAFQDPHGRRNANPV